MSNLIAVTGEAPAATYRRHLEQGKLAYQFSASLGRAVFFPRLVSPETGMDDLEWRVSSGNGTVYATTVVHPREGEPYNVAMVDCDEGFRLMSRVDGIDPYAVAIGQRVTLAIGAPRPGEPIQPLFVPMETQS